MFQVTSQAHFIGLILHGSAIVQLTAVNALPQPSNVQERQFATQMEHVRVNIKNLNNFNDKPKTKFVPCNIKFVINQKLFHYHTCSNFIDTTTTIKPWQNHELSTR